MGVAASATLAANGKVVGVIPHALAIKEIALENATELIVVDTMHERKAIMADRADAFVALPGGFGTCDELFEILTWAQLGIHTKPVVVLNMAGFFDPLIAWAEHMVREGFLRTKHRELLLISGSVKGLFELLDSWKPAAIVAKWALPGER